MTAAQLIAWRARLGWSLTQAAEALGVERRTYMRWEADERPVSLTVAKLAQLIDLHAAGGRAIGEAPAAKRARVGSNR